MNSLNNNLKVFAKFRQSHSYTIKQEHVGLKNLVSCTPLRLVRTQNNLGKRGKITRIPTIIDEFKTTSNSTFVQKVMWSTNTKSHAKTEKKYTKVNRTRNYN
jgi:hypothetical protein